MSVRRHRLLDTWPRRARGLPAGQRELKIFPRFGDAPRRRPPAGSSDRPADLTVARDGTEVELTADALFALDPVVLTADFHCVTTWTYRDVTWTGVPMRNVWEELIAPVIPTDEACWVVACGLDRYRAVLHIDDLLHPSTMLARQVDDVPLNEVHGAPLRLISPTQYGYKNVKHLTAFALHVDQPATRLGPKEHPRARVELEERHSRIPGWLLRWPYRLVIPLTVAAAAER